MLCLKKIFNIHILRRKYISNLIYKYFSESILYLFYEPLLFNEIYVAKINIIYICNTKNSREINYFACSANRISEILRHELNKNIFFLENIDLKILGDLTF